MASDDSGRDDKNVETEHFETERQGTVVSCVLKGTADAMTGAVMGAVLGFGTGLFQRQGFKAALNSSASSAKTFAMLSGIHGLISSLLVHVRGKKDALNAGIAGCATGFALSAPGNPVALVQGCVSFGLFSYLIERMNAQPALAAAAAAGGATCSSSRKQIRQARCVNEWQFPVLPPFSLAPPEGLFVFNQPKMHLLGLSGV